MKEFKLFATLIQVAFIVMKLCGAIHWSWLLVFSPILLYLFRFVLAFFCVKHEIKQSQKNFRDRMDNLKRLQQEYQDAVNKRKKEMEEKKMSKDKAIEYIKRAKEQLSDELHTVRFCQMARNNLDKALKELEDNMEQNKERLSFRTFDKVLVRNLDELKWRPAIFVQTRIGDYSPYRYNALLLSTGQVGDFTQCIKYEGNEKMAFTADPF